MHNSKGGCPFRRMNRITNHISPSDTAADVQEMLSKLEYYNGKVDGFVGPRTEAAVKAFQYTQGLTADGWAGPRTLTTLQEVLQAKNMSNSQDDDMQAAGTVALPPALPEDSVAYNTDVHRYLRKLHDQAGDTFVLTRDGQPVVFVRSPQAVRQVLMDEDNFGKTWDSAKVSNSNADYVMNLVQPMVTNTIFNMHGEANALRRKLLRPTFLGIDAFINGFSAATEHVLSQLPNGVVDIQDTMHTVLRRNLCVAFFGENISFVDKQMHHFHTTMEYFVQRYAQPCHSQDVTQLDEKHLENIVQASLDMINAFRAAPRGAAAERSIVGLMLEKGLSDDEIAGTMVNVMIAAGEAPAGALALILQELCHNKPAQEQLFEEVNRVIGQEGEPMHHMQELSYVERCVREGLRIFAPATLVQRAALQDTELDGYFIPKGQVIGVCVHAVHMDPKVWEEPECFNPYREGNKYEVIKGDRAFVAFSGGPRGCPGKHLAVGIMRVVLAKMVQQFKIDPAPVVNKVVPKFVEWKVEGIPVTLTRRR